MLKLLREGYDGRKKDKIKKNINLNESDKEISEDFRKIDNDVNVYGSGVEMIGENDILKDVKRNLKWEFE